MNKIGEVVCFEFWNQILLQNKSLYRHQNSGSSLASHGYHPLHIFEGLFLVNGKELIEISYYVSLGDAASKFFYHDKFNSKLLLGTNTSTSDTAKTKIVWRHWIINDTTESFHFLHIGLMSDVKMWQLVLWLIWTLWHVPPLLLRLRLLMFRSISISTDPIAKTETVWRHWAIEGTTCSKMEVLIGYISKTKNVCQCPFVIFDCDILSI